MGGNGGGTDVGRPTEQAAIAATGAGCGRTRDLCGYRAVVAVPDWVPIVSAIGGLGVGAAINPTVEIVKARITAKTAGAAVEATREATEANRETARETHQRETAKSNRELILQAIEWTRSEVELTHDQGWALLEGMSTLTLTPSDAVLITSVTRPLIERRLSEARRLVEIEGEDVAFGIDIGPRPRALEVEGGDSDQDP